MAGIKFSLGGFSEDPKLIGKYKNQYNEHGYVEIFDFLDAESVHLILGWYQSEMPREWLYHCFCAGRGRNQHYKNHMTMETASEMEKTHREVLRTADNGEFSFSFLKTGAGVDGQHHKECRCLECEFKSFLNSEAALAPIEKITGMSLRLPPNKVFGSTYQAGDFLTPHNDGHHGCMTGAFSLTKKWKPQWGAQTQLLDTDGRVIHSAIPQFNRLLLFKIPIDHQVTYVPDYVTAKRYGMTLWYQDINNLKDGEHGDDY